MHAFCFFFLSSRKGITTVTTINAITIVGFGLALEAEQLQVKPKWPLLEANRGRIQVGIMFVSVFQGIPRPVMGLCWRNLGF